VAVRLSVIVPTRNEAAVIAATLAPLQALRPHGVEIILVDGGSCDATCQIAAPLVDRLLHSEAGRARQMNLGASAAAAEALWFLHADTVVTPAAAEAVLAALADYAWGRFDVRLSGRAWLLRLVERMMNWRSCLTHIATGDQAICVRRSLFQAVGGYPEWPLMEDIELSRRLRRHGAPACLRPAITTSSRRWEAHGVVRTILLMFWLRFAHAIGVDVTRLARWYRRSDQGGG
jgi:rSAM/selenodomain-associated transferase 2